MKKIMNLLLVSASLLLAGCSNSAPANTEIPDNSTNTGDTETGDNIGGEDAGSAGDNTEGFRVSKIVTPETSIYQEAGKIIEGYGYVINPGTTIFGGYKTVPEFSIPNLANFSKILKIEENAIFASPNGNSLASATLKDPLDFDTALAHLGTNEVDTLYLIGGTYSFNKTLQLSNGGSENKYKSIIAYNDEEVIFNFSNQPFGDSSRGVSLQSNYYYLKGITIEYAGDNGLLCGSSNNRIENCVFRFNQDSGFQLSRFSSTQTNNTLWPSNNYILNCTSYSNYDSLRATSKGEDADGFAAKLTCGLGNVFNGCITYRNSDDGFDLYCKNTSGDSLQDIGSITILNSFAYQNGYPYLDESRRNEITEAGDGNGYKMGSKETSIPHTIINCVASENMAKGFDDNNSAGPYYIAHCSAYNNGRIGGANFSYHSQDTHYSYLDSCISFSVKANTGKDSYKGVATNCYFGTSQGAFPSWYVYNSLASCDSSSPTSNKLTITDAINGPYKSVSINLLSYLPTVSLHKELRNSFGNISLNDYLSLSNLNTGANLK